MREILVLVILSILFPNNVFAHSGRTDEFGGHTCRTNCEDYGLDYGEYHYHDGGDFLDDLEWESPNDEWEDQRTEEEKRASVKANDYWEDNPVVDENYDEQDYYDNFNAKYDDKNEKEFHVNGGSDFFDVFSNKVITYAVIGAVIAVVFGFLKDIFKKKN
jgi:hypothetical protein